MTILSKLNLSDKTKTAMLTSPEAKLRGKMLEALDLQMEAAKAMLNGETYIRRAMRWVKDPETGERVRKEVPVRSRPWFWKDEQRHRGALVGLGGQEPQAPAGLVRHLAPGRAAQVDDARDAVAELVALAQDQHLLDQVDERGRGDHPQARLAEPRDGHRLVAEAPGEGHVVELEREGQAVERQIEIVRIADPQIDPEALLQEAALQQPDVHDMDLGRSHLADLRASGQRKQGRQSHERMKKPHRVRPSGRG